MVIKNFNLKIVAHITAYLASLIFLLTLLLSLEMIFTSVNLRAAAWRPLKSLSDEVPGLSINLSGPVCASVVSSRPDFKGLVGSSGKLEILEGVCPVKNFCESGLRAHSNSCKIIWSLSGNACFVR